MDNLESNTLIVYGHGYCGQSLMLKKALNDNHIEHEWRDVIEGDPKFSVELKELARGNLSVPTVIFPDGTVMVEPWPSQVLNRLQPHQPSFIERILPRQRGDPKSR